MSRAHEFSVTLQRNNTNQAWGLRLVGGADAGAPLIITKTIEGSPADRQLRRGDIVKKIGEYDARDLRHEDAQNLIMNAGNTVKLVVQRKQGAPPTAVAAASAPLPTASSQPARVASPGPLSPTTMRLQQTEAARPASPIVFPPPLPTSDGMASRSSGGPAPFAPIFPSAAATNWTPSHVEEEVAINNQPYRTTPLVLPGAKVKKDAAPTVSYLRHHPNPMFRQPPAHYDTTAEVLMKQKVADTVLQRVAGEDAAGGKQVVHKQFNSPIGLYSDENIAQTIQAQTGATPSNPRTSTLDRRNQAKVSLKPTLSFDPAKSETFKALQESELGDQIQEVPVPVEPKVFSPTKSLQAKRAPPPQQAKKPVTGHPANFSNSISHYEETIQQSGSFKRLMNRVLGQSEF